MEQIGLVLQGGGALGAFEWGVIERLLEQKTRIDIVSGISIGAVNAAVLCGAKCRPGEAKPDPLAALRGMWNLFNTVDIPFAPPALNEFIAKFGVPGLYTPRSDLYDFLRWTYFWHTYPLLGTLNTFVDFSRLAPGGDGTRLILGATNVKTGEMDLFDSAKMAITPEHIRSAISIPPNFPAVTIPGADPSQSKTYWDGGLFNNTLFEPILKAMSEDPRSKKRIIIVELFPNEGEIPHTMPDVLARMTDILFANKIKYGIERERERNLLRQVLRHVPSEQSPILAELRHDPAARELLDQPFEVEFVTIAKTPSEGYGAWNDFSHETIERRRRHGYEAAAKDLPALPTR